MTNSEKIQVVKKQILFPFDITGRVTPSLAEMAEEVFAYWFKSGLWSEKIANSVIKYKRCSEKQAFVMARDFVNNMPEDKIERILNI